MAKEQVTCPKCDGVGSLSAFGHVANGVCFCCKGKKVVTVDKQKLIDKIRPENQKKAEWILASTEASYVGLSFAKLSAIRDFAHCGWGLQEAYPDMLAHWFKVGEAAFQAAQEAHLADFYSNR